MAKPTYVLGLANLSRIRLTEGSTYPPLFLRNRCNKKAALSRANAGTGLAAVAA